MRLYSYIVRYDYGFAPNPFHGWCTLATCKQDFRARAREGDWVIGTGSRNHRLDGTLVYAMRVQETLTFDNYWNDPRFTAKRPNLSGSLKQRYGDNIYHRDSAGSWIQEDSRHSREGGLPDSGHVVKDTRANAVLVSTEYWYFGGHGPLVPRRFRDWSGRDICHHGPGYGCRFPMEMVVAFTEWIATLKRGYRGDPVGWG